MSEFGGLWKQAKDEIYVPIALSAFRDKMETGKDPACIYRTG